MFQQIPPESSLHGIIKKIHYVTRARGRQNVFNIDRPGVYYDNLLAAFISLIFSLVWNYRIFLIVIKEYLICFCFILLIYLYLTSISD